MRTSQIWIGATDHLSRGAPDLRTLPTRVMIVDADLAERRAVGRLISETDGFALVGEFWLPEEGLEALHYLAPDLVVVSARMKLLGWREFSRLVTRARPSTKVLVLTDGNDPWPDAGSARVEVASRGGLGARQLRRVCGTGLSLDGPPPSIVTG
jgi:hypothetical protein